MSSLKHQTVRGALQLGGSTLVVRVIAVISGIVLARLLDPVQFGLVSLAYVVLNVVSLLAPMGLGAALIRHRGDRATASFQVFVAVMVSGAAYFLVVVLAAGPLARFLGNPELRTILPWLATLILIDAAGRVPEALLEKDLAFGIMSRIAILSETTHVVVTVGLAAAGAGVWSLVAGHCARSGVQATLTIVLCRSREWLTPKPWSWPVMKELIAFGLPMVGSAAVYRFYLNIDNFVVGRQLGATALGFYAKAFSFTTSTVDSLYKTLGSVLFPSYAKIQEDQERLTSAYLKSLRVVSLITIPLALGLLAIAPVLVPTLLGRKWEPMVPILQVLAVMSVFKPLSATTSAVFSAVGKPGNNLRAGLVVSTVMVPAIFLLLPWGPVGVAWAVVIAHVAGFAFNIRQMGRLFPAAGRRMMPVSLPAFAAGGVSAVAMHATRLVLPAPGTELGGVPVIAAMALTGALVYGGFLALFERPLVVEVTSLLLRRKEKTA